MATDVPDIELIENYLHGNLAPEEVKNFEQALETDAQLKAEVQEHLKALVLAKEIGKNQWREQMKTRFSDEAPVIREFNRPLIFTLVACLLALLILGGLWLNQRDTALSPEKWVAAHVEIPTAPELKSPDQYEKWAAANYAYNQENYVEALATYEEIEPEFTGGFQREIIFYKAMSLFYLDRYEDALDTFGKIDSGPYQEMALWYGAVSYVKAGELGQAQLALEAIAGKAGFYQEKAQELLKSFE